MNSRNPRNSDIYCDGCVRNHPRMWRRLNADLCEQGIYVPGRGNLCPVCHSRWLDDCYAQVEFGAANEDDSPQGMGWVGKDGRP